MKLDIFQIDAFTDTVFGGNPACVVPLHEWLPDAVLLSIAKENAVAETAFFIDNGYETVHLRWFTPEIEMDLCGHATLATAHVLSAHRHYPNETIHFTTQSGVLSVSVEQTNGEQNRYTLDFPSRKAVPAPLPEIIRQSFSKQPFEVLQARDFLLVYETEQDVRDIQVHRQIFDQINLDPGGVIVTARGTTCDFVSRFFTPQASILEDPVTGSAHCSLIPYWSERLGKEELTALQVSERVGRLWCVDKGERVLIQGTARTYSVGTIWTE